MNNKIYVKLIAVVVIALQLICFISYGSVINTGLKSPSNADTDNINLPPNVDFQLQKQRKVDLRFIVGDTSSYTEASVTAQVNAVLKPRLDDEDIIYTVSVGSSKTGTTPILTSLESITFDSSKDTYYIYIADKALSELTTAPGQSAILSKLLSSNVNIIGLGNSSNQSQLETLISKNGGCGKFISNGNAATAFSQLADYICKNCSANIVINLGDTGYTLDTVKSRVNAVLKPMLSQNGINNNITYKNVKKVEDRLIWVNKNNNKNIYAYDSQTNATTVIGTMSYSVKDACMSRDSKIYYIPMDYNGETIEEIRVYDLITKTDKRYTLPPTYDYYGTNYYTPTDIAVDSNGTICINAFRVIYSAEYGTYTYNSKTLTWSYLGVTMSNIVTAANGNAFVGICQSYDGSGNRNLAANGSSVPSGTLSDSNSFPQYLTANRDGNFYYAAHATQPGLYKYTPGVGITNGVFSAPFNQRNIYINMVSGDSGKLLIAARGTGNYVSDPSLNPYGLYEVDTTTNTSRQLVPGNSDHTFTMYAYSQSNKLLYYGDSFYGYSPSAGGYVTTKTNYIYDIKNGTIQNTSFSYNGDFKFLNSIQPFDIYSDKAVPISDVLSPAFFKNDGTDYFVQISDKSIDELADNTKLTQIANDLKGSNVRFVGLGRSANSTQLKALTDAVGLGDYFDNTSLDSALTNLGNYIIDVSMPKSRKLSNYILDTDTIDSYSTSYNDPECDAYDNIFSIAHDPSHFIKGNGSSISISNSNGYSSYNGRYVSSLPGTFTEVDSLGNTVSKVGAYTIEYKANDKPKADDTRFDEYRQLSNTSTQKVNVCRKPIAQYTITHKGNGQSYNIELSDNGYSYSPDHTGRTDKGIALRKWGIAEVTADTADIEWSYTITTNKTITYNVQTGREYLVSLQVQDINADDGYGFWSDPLVRTVKTTDIPVAIFSIAPNPLLLSGTATVTDSSYAVTYGATITKRRWNIKKVGDATFSYANKDYCKTNYSDSGIGTYEITLEVCDSYNLWSKPYKQTLRVIENQAPTITAAPTSRAWSNADIVVDVSATDSGGSGLAAVEYGWTKDSSYLSSVKRIVLPAAQYRNSYNFNTTQTQEGIWYLFARASDYSGNYSNSGNFKVWGSYKCDKTDPSGVFNVKSRTAESTTVTFAPTDKLSGVYHWRYRISLDSGCTYGDWSLYYTGDKTGEIILNQSGYCVIQAEVTDNAGNIAIVGSDVYEVAALGITDVSITGYWNHWRGQVDMFGKQLTNEPHRFLSLERVKIDIKTVGDPDRVTVRFSPELEAMTYSDPHGNVYNYGDFFDYKVKFPEDSTFAVSNNHISWEYNLPLALSTKDWNNLRQRPAYTMIVTAYKGSSSVVAKINDIEITGNIYDLTYIQPVQ